MQSAPAAPAPPDPYKTSSAQTQGDVQSAIANSIMGNADTYTPYGSQTTTQSGTYQIKDALGNLIDVPKFTQTQTLSPAQQQLFDQQNQLGSSMNNLALSQVGRLQDVLGQPINTNGLPGAVNSIDFGPTLQKSFGMGGPIQSSVDLNTNARTSLGLDTDFGQTAGSIQYGIGPNDFSKDRDRVEDALMSRLQTSIDKDRGAQEARLANQGIVGGSQAYNTETDTFNRSVNDARLGAILNAGQEQSRLQGLAYQQGSFNNAAQQQDFGQQQARGTFANTAKTAEGQFYNSGIEQNNNAILGMGQFANAAQQQQYGQNAQAAEFNNNALQQQYANLVGGAQFANTARERALQEQLALRNQPINEISSLMSGGQVSMPQFSQFQGGQVAGSTIGSNIYNSANLANQQWQTQAGMAAQNNAGIYGLGSSLLGAGGKMFMGGLR